jgi:aryl-alcohol dehydrogenase-like predicted oxidoreductase
MDGRTSLGFAAVRAGEYMLSVDGKVQLGVGLIEIGRPWGCRVTSVPEEKTALKFLHGAYELGITFFDTAASYGSSEERLGRFLRTLSPSDRARLTIATKFGEHWNPETQHAYADHSYGALCASVDRSLSRLGRIDLLQLHKATPAVLRSREVSRAWDYAQRQGITGLGASVSDAEAGSLASEDARLSAIQLPYNTQNTTLDAVIDLAVERHKVVVVNRPYNMGRIFYGDANAPPHRRRVEAFRWILRKKFSGVILTGTKSSPHLAENWSAYQQALQEP